MPESSESPAGDEAGHQEPLAPGAGEPGSRTSSTGKGADWAAEVAGRIESAVGSVRSRTSDRLVDLARLVVFGLIAATMACVALVLVLITFVRILDVALPGEIWLPYLVLGSVLLVGGGLLWPRRSSPPAP